MTKISVVGAAGRMGLRLVALCQADPELRLVGAIVGATSPQLGKDAGTIAGMQAIGVPLSADLVQTPDVLIDFSTPQATRHWLSVCRDQQIAMLIGTTGLEPADLAAIDAAATCIPILQASNTSFGVSVLLRLISEAARLLDDRFDIEIVEAHHRFKKDAPSGTARTIAETIVRTKRLSSEVVKQGRRNEDGPRQPGEIGLHSLRHGDEVGRHTVTFATLGERIELTHAASSRDTFAAGALLAAKWLAGQKPGRFAMSNVLDSASTTACD